VIAGLLALALIAISAAGIAVRGAANASRQAANASRQHAIALSRQLAGAPPRRSVMSGRPHRAAASHWDRLPWRVLAAHPLRLVPARHGHGSAGQWSLDVTQAKCQARFRQRTPPLLIKPASGEVSRKWAS
jgi:hypothetical protein